jgi:cytochrome P450 PksS
MEHLDQLEKLRTSPGLIKPAVEELLRFTSPVETATDRYTREDVTVAVCCCADSKRYRWRSAEAERGRRP